MTVRCAIYTRKSTEHGLEQEFNSLLKQVLQRTIIIIIGVILLIQNAILVVFIRYVWEDARTVTFQINKPRV